MLNYYIKATLCSKSCGGKSKLKK